MGIGDRVPRLVDGGGQCRQVDRAGGGDLDATGVQVDLDRGDARRGADGAEMARLRGRRLPVDAHVAVGRARREELAAGQEPFAIILGCSDSRVPAEIVFDQGLGDLFVIRVAGNIIAPSLVGSVEFAAERFGTRLVVVLGHSSCGAILATIEEKEPPLAVCGHIHEAWGDRSEVGATTVANLGPRGAEFEV